MKNINLLFTNVGRRTYLVDFALALQKQGYPLKVFVSDVSKYTSGFWVSKKIKYFLTPLVNQDSSDYANSLLEQCKKNKINVIIPLLDFELPILSSRKNFFKDKGIEVIVSDYDVVDRCLNKKKSYYFCLENKIPVPESYFSINDIAGRLPLIKKKILGSASIGLEKISDKGSHINFIKDEDMLQEYIEGDEFGMNILNDLKGNFVHATYCQKISMRAGETDKAVGVFSDKFLSLAKKISKAYKHKGNMDVDFIVGKNNKIYCLDFNPRLGGVYPIAHFSGFNYLKYMLDMVQLQKVKIPTKGKKVAFVKGISVHSINP